MTTAMSTVVPNAIASAPAAPPVLPAAFGAALADLASDTLGPLRERARASLLQTGFPNQRVEAWRFTSLSPVLKESWSTARPGDGASAAVLPAAVEAFRYPGCCNLVVVDGVFRPDLSEDVPVGVLLSSLSGGASNELIGQLANVEQHVFTALNSALLSDALYIGFAERTVVEQPLHIIHLATGRGLGNGAATAAYPRLFLHARTSSQATVIETYASLDDGRTLTCPVTELLAEDNAVLRHYKVQKESLSTSHIAGFFLALGRDAQVNSNSFIHGGALVRNDVVASLDAPGIECTLNGLYIVSTGQHVDTRMRVEHRAPHCASHELWKGVLDGRARAAFSGLIYVHKGAQKTDAKQTNRNLVLSDQALASSQPQLEIYADDVRCTHGSTTGQIEPEALFYLRSRGIDADAATSLLTYAFASELVEEIQVEALRRDLQNFLFSRLPGGETVRQAV